MAGCRSSQLGCASQAGQSTGKGYPPHKDQTSFAREERSQKNSSNCNESLRGLDGSSDAVLRPPARAGLAGRHPAAQAWGSAQLLPGGVGACAGGETGVLRRVCSAVLGRRRREHRSVFPEDGDGGDSSSGLSSDSLRQGRRGEIRKTKGGLAKLGDAHWGILAPCLPNESWSFERVSRRGGSDRSGRPRSEVG